MIRPALVLAGLLALPWAAAAASPTLMPDAPDLPTWSIAFGTDRDRAAFDARGWHETFTAAHAVAIPARLTLATVRAESAAQRPVAVTYSRGYEVRAKIHKYASVATLPLFVAEYVVGQKLYDGTGGSGARSAHGALAGGIAALFGVNTVTGVWNLVEARSDPNGRTRRWVHGLLMLAADAGFAATGALAPDDDEGGSGSGNRSLHRNVAITSMSLATVGYLVMLLPH